MLFRFASDDDKGNTSITVENGNSCLTLGGYGEVQAFLYTFDKDSNTYSQEKLAQPEKFTLSEDSIGSPGQCLIVEFSHVKDRTEKLCQDFGEIDAERCTQFGVLNFDPNVCKAREIRDDSESIIPGGTL